MTIYSPLNFHSKIKITAVFRTYFRLQSVFLEYFSVFSEIPYSPAVDQLFSTIKAPLFESHFSSALSLQKPYKQFEILFQ